MNFDIPRQCWQNIIFQFARNFAGSRHGIRPRPFLNHHHDRTAAHHIRQPCFLRKAVRHLCHIAQPNQRAPRGTDDDLADLLRCRKLARHADGIIELAHLDITGRQGHIFLGQCRGNQIKLQPVTR